MRIEFRTVYDDYTNEKLGQIYSKHFIDNQKKAYNIMKVILVIIAAWSLIMGIATENYALCISGPLYIIFGFLIIGRAKNKVIPKSFAEQNKVGCPYNVTFGLYDEYFYEKVENNMLISEESVRYEFLQKLVETPEFFVMMTKRNQLFVLPKRDMGYEAAMEFSAFCKRRLPYIYSVG